MGLGLDWIEYIWVLAAAWAWVWECVWDVMDDTPWVADHVGVFAFFDSTFFCSRHGVLCIHSKSQNENITLIFYCNAHI